MKYPIKNPKERESYALMQSDLRLLVIQQVQVMVTLLVASMIILRFPTPYMNLLTQFRCLIGCVRVLKNSLPIGSRSYSSTYDKFPFDQMWNKELSIRLGQCPVKKYNEQLLHLIESGRIDATKIISHTMKLDELSRELMRFLTIRNKMRQK